MNNAGIDQPPGQTGKGYRLEDIPFEINREILEVNTLGAFLVTQVFGRPMLQASRGSIINIGSLYAGVAPDGRFYDHIKCDPPFLKPPAYAMVVRDGFQIHFGRSDSGESNSNSRQHAIISDFIIWVPEIHMFYEEIKANGVDIVQDIVKRIYGSREFVFRDCNGYKVTVGD